MYIYIYTYTYSHVLFVINMYITSFVDLFVTPHSTPFDLWPYKRFWALS